MAKQKGGSTSLVARPPIHPASFEKWDPDRHNDIFLYLEDDDQRENYRYKLTVIDRKEISADGNVGGSNVKLQYATAVFLIPAGRESEYMFHSSTGLRAVAASAGTARLIAVTFGRLPHFFHNQASVKDELTYVVQILAAKQELLSQTNVNVNTASIPFMALDGIGERNVLASGTTVTSGRYLVEQCLADEGQYVRRLYFLDGNPFVIQSEVTLKKSGSDFVVDKSITAFDYHKNLTVGILALLPDSAVATGVLIGLGGGGLVNLWHLLKTAWTVTAIELDPAVAEIAAEYFGLDCTKLEVRIGDGLSVHSLNGAATGTNTTNDPAVDSVKLNYSDVGEKHAGLGFEAESLDFIVIDVDSKDTKIGMSCPPAAFVEGIFLETLSSLLRKNTGVLAINVSARDPTMFQDVCKAVRSVFPSVILSKRCFSKEGDNDDDDAEKEDLNVVVFASRRPDESLPSPRELANRVTLRIQHLQKSNITSEIDEILLSDLCSCLEEFAVFDESATRSAPTKSNAGKKKTTGSNKRRNNKRGSNKRR